jgi:hypothetical protein
MSGSLGAIDSEISIIIDAGGWEAVFPKQTATTYWNIMKVSTYRPIHRTNGAREKSNLKG